MRLVGYNQNGLRLIGSVSDDMVTPLGGVEDFYRSGGTLKPSGAAPIPLAELELVPFVPVTSRVFCVGINYKVHAAEALEVGGIDEPKVPSWAANLRSTTLGFRTRRGRYKYSKCLTHSTNPDHLIPRGLFPTNVPPLRVAARYTTERPRARRALRRS